MLKDYFANDGDQKVTGKVNVRDVKIDEIFELETLDEPEVEIEPEEVIEE